ncbi:DUF3592 domain-containing protein [Rhodococcus antarcticus]|uniref:DUF3592 domain-containing protein n=1 Tax=Rhodococcus antarcticus TaxID=2987751 RepID=A0ABY6P0S5_9NOCA|nr:DUF3592 domain-containing protein [Rhodococcus antarcticus]UZJ25269.1 DUF3592 domain-containing protein [Rhodococcus antarcticus]
MTSRTRSRLHRAVLVVAAGLTVLAVLLVVAAFSDDRAITGHRGTAVADVLSVSPRSAAISFTTPDGVTHAPQLGVLYPTGLTAGQRIDVEYSTVNPNLVRVAGRGWTLALLPAGSVVVVTWLVAAGALALLHRRVRPVPAELS